MNTNVEKKKVIRIGRLGYNQIKKYIGGKLVEKESRFSKLDGLVLCKYLYK